MGSSRGVVIKSALSEGPCLHGFTQFSHPWVAPHCHNCVTYFHQGLFGACSLQQIVYKISLCCLVSSDPLLNTTWDNVLVHKFPYHSVREGTHHPLMLTVGPPPLTVGRTISVWRHRASDMQTTSTKLPVQTTQ